MKELLSQIFGKSAKPWSRSPQPSEPMDIVEMLMQEMDTTTKQWLLKGQPSTKCQGVS